MKTLTTLIILIISFFVSSSTVPLNDYYSDYDTITTTTVPMFTGAELEANFPVPYDAEACGYWYHLSYVNALWRGTVYPLDTMIVYFFGINDSSKLVDFNDTTAIKKYCYKQRTNDEELFRDSLDNTNVKVRAKTGIVRLLKQVNYI